MPVYDSIIGTIGRTPIVALNRICEKYNTCARVLAKLEMFNPGGSSKDRAALSMLRDAEKRGLIKPGAVIIEPTSGNTGIGLSMVAAARGYEAVIIMPDSMSKERIMLMRAYGAEVIQTPGVLGMKGAVDKAEELAAKTPGSYIPGQFVNPENAMAHYRTTGPELWEDTEGQIDIFTATVGTGGTLTGCGRYLREKNPDISIYAVEPASSPLLSEGHAGPHKIQGIGANFIPGVLDTHLYNGVLTVKDEDAFTFARELGSVEGILAGISSGAAVCAAVRLACDPANKGKTVATVLIDTGERYLSSGLFE